MATITSDNRREIARLPNRPVRRKTRLFLSMFVLFLPKISLEDRYDPPANFLEIEILNPETHGFAGKRYTDYEIRMRVNDTCSIDVLLIFVRCLSRPICLSFG